MHLQAKLENLL